MQLGGGEGGGRGVRGRGGGESAGFTGQSQLPQGVQGVHLGSSQQVALTLQHTETPGCMKYISIKAEGGNICCIAVVVSWDVIGRRLDCRNVNN